MSNTKLLPILSILALGIVACGGADVATTQVDEADPTTTLVATTSASTTVAEAHEEGEDHSEERTEENDSDHEGQRADGIRVIEVVMTEFAFEPASFSVVAGETVRFVVTNDGVVDHEFRLSNAHRVEEHMASGHADHAEEGGHHEEGGDVFIIVKPGETGEVEMTFPEDASLYTEVSCLLPGHYENGMTAPLTVEAN